MVKFFPFFQWASDLWVGDWIRNSTWIFPAIETVHIVALAILFGAIAFVDLQILGLVRKDSPVSQLERELRPWTFCSLIVILVSGALLFASEATKLYFSDPFRIKVVMLFLAIVFHYTIHRSVAKRQVPGNYPVLGKLTAAISMLLWLSVGVAGRAIGFF